MTLSWTTLQARARACEAENDMTGALANYDQALLVFPTPRLKDSIARNNLARLERERNLCQQSIWHANGGMPVQTEGLYANEGGRKN